MRFALFDYSVFGYLLFSVRLFNLFSIVLCPDTGIIFQVFRSRYTTDVPVNIKHLAVNKHHTSTRTRPAPVSDLA
jgi:hypothetical protein